MTDFGSLIDQLGRTALECQQLIREMHEAQQDLKATIKEAREAKEAIDKYLVTGIEDSIKKNLDELGTHTQKAIADTSNKILSEFDRLSKPLLDSLDMVRAHISALEQRSKRALDEGGLL